MSERHALDRMYAAFAEGDVAAARACFTPEARIWHCFDGEAQDVETAAKAWAGLFAHSRARSIEDVRCQPTPDGIVQQHLFLLELPSGERKAWPVCIVVRFEGGLIARLDEYIDRAGSFDLPDGVRNTPGF